MCSLIRKVATYNANLTMTQLNLKPKRNTTLPTRLRVGDVDSTDRESWIQEARAFGMARFQEGEANEPHRYRNTFYPRPWAKKHAEEDTDVTTNVDQSSNHDRTPAETRRRTEDTQNICLWETLRARAEMKEGTSPGMNGITSSIYKYVPFTMVHDIVELFQQRMEGRQEAPRSWQELQFVAIPKPDRVDGFKGFRWICVSDVLHKWYLRIVRNFIRSETTKTPLHAYGFRPGTSTTHLTGLVRESSAQRKNGPTQCTLPSRTLRPRSTPSLTGSSRKRFITKEHQRLP